MLLQHSISWWLLVMRMIMMTMRMIMMTMAIVELYFGGTGNPEKRITWKCSVSTSDRERERARERGWTKICQPPTTNCQYHLEKLTIPKILWKYNKYVQNWTFGISSTIHHHCFHWWSCHHHQNCIVWLEKKTGTYIGTRFPPFFWAKFRKILFSNYAHWRLWQQAQEAIKEICGFGALSKFGKSLSCQILTFHPTPVHLHPLRQLDQRHPHPHWYRQCHRHLCYRGFVRLDFGRTWIWTASWHLIRMSPMSGPMSCFYCRHATICPGGESMSRRSPMGGEGVCAGDLV